MTIDTLLFVIIAIMYVTQCYSNMEVKDELIRIQLLLYNKRR